MSVDPLLALVQAPRAQHLGGRSAVGRTTDAVRCACGHVNHFYRWSWAGHGKARCAGCRGWINYTTLAVTEGK
jgi:hypothetical protein